MTVNVSHAVQVKLELADNTEKFNMGAQVIEAACPLVGHLLPTMSSQVKGVCVMKQTVQLS